MIRGFIILFALSALLTGCASSPEQPEDAESVSKGKIRFYRVNKIGQQTGFTLVKGADKAGCHNLFKKSALHRVAVTGFEYCQVYAQKDCQAGSQLTAQWSAKRIKSEDKKQPTTKFSKGSRWVFDPEGNVQARSWRCQ